VLGNIMFADRHTQQVLDPPAPEVEDQLRPSARVQVHAPFAEFCPGEFDHQLHRPLQGEIHPIRVYTAFEAVGSLGCNVQPAGRPADAHRVEARRFQQDRTGRFGHLGFLTAHDPGYGNRALRVADHEHVRFKIAELAVQGGKLTLPCLRTADHDPTASKLCTVKGVQGLSEL